MILSFNIASIVVKYLEPKCLANFLKDDRVGGMEMKFMYDGSQWMMNFDECNAVYGMFVNMVLIGVHFCDEEINVNREFIVDVGKVVRCRVTNLSKCSLFNKLPYQLEKCVGIKVLDLIDYEDDLTSCNLSRYVNLHTINVITKSRASSQYLDGLSKCENLKCLRLINVRLCDKDIWTISNCENLIHLEISDYVHTSLFCEKLRTLVMVNSHNLNNIFCNEIECILLEKCKNLVDISRLKSFPNLECVEIVECEKLEDLSVLDECVNLKWIRVDRDYRMSDNLIKLMSNCSHKHRCGHKYKYMRYK